MTSISLVNQGLKPLIVVALGCVFFFSESGWSSQVFWGSKTGLIGSNEIPSFTELMVAVLSAPESCYLVWKCHSLLKMGQKCFFPQNEEDCLPTIVFWEGRVKLQGSINTCCIWYFYYIYRYIFYMTVLALRCWDHHLYYQTSRYIKRICRHFLSRHSLLGISGWSADEWFKICGSKMILYIYIHIYTQLH